MTGPVDEEHQELQMKGILQLGKFLPASPRRSGSDLAARPSSKGVIHTYVGRVNS